MRSGAQVVLLPCVSSIHGRVCVAHMRVCKVERGASYTTVLFLRPVESWAFAHMPSRF